MTLLKANNLTKEFIKGVKVLDNISLEITSGDFVSILGPSGSGKSTLLTLLAGIDKPTNGNVYLDDLNLSEATEKELAILRRTKIGYVFQFFNLVPYMSVRENILLPLILNGRVTKQMHKEVDALMKDLGLFSYANRLPSKLSGGEQQRVAIARSMIFKPGILFLDEPTGNLDSKTGHEIMLLLSKLNKEYGTTIVQVTHSRENAKFSSKLIFIKDGVLVTELEADIVTDSLSENEGVLHATLNSSENLDEEIIYNGKVKSNKSVQEEITIDDIERKVQELIEDRKEDNE